MFEIFDNIAEVVLVFFKEELIYANNAACFFFGCYEKNLLRRSFGEIFEEASFTEVFDMIPEGKEEKITLSVRKGSSETFRVRIISENEGKTEKSRK